MAHRHRIDELRGYEPSGADTELPLSGVVLCCPPSERVLRGSGNRCASLCVAGGRSRLLRSEAWRRQIAESGALARASTWRTRRSAMRGRAGCIGPVRSRSAERSYRIHLCRSFGADGGINRRAAGVGQNGARSRLSSRSAATAYADEHDLVWALPPQNYLFASTAISTVRPMRRASAAGYLRHLRFSPRPERGD
jgi:hypothetical protein